MLKLNSQHNVNRWFVFEIVFCFLFFLNLLFIEEGFLVDIVQGRWVYFVDLIIIFMGILKIIIANKRIEQETIRLWIFFSVPYVFLLCWSTFWKFFNTDISINNAFITMAYWLIPIMTATVTYCAFEERGLWLSIIVMLINYLCVIARAVEFKGFMHLFKLSTYTNNFGSVLEVHEIGLTMGLILLYYFFCHVLYKNKLDWIFWSGVIVLLMCGKRIAIAAFILIVVFYKLCMSYGLRKQGRRVKGIMLLIISITFVYLFVVESGIISFVFTYLKINSNTRMEMWEYFANMCNISPFYEGLGLGYTMQHLKEIGGIYVDGLLMPVGDLHNDVFKMYIEVGFIPSVFFWVYFFYGQARVFINKKKKTAVLYFMFAAYTAMLAFTDNVLRYNLFLYFFYLIIFIQNRKERVENKTLNV